MKVLVKGSIEKVGATAFDRGMFNAGLFSQGKLLGEGPVDENGSYAFSIEAAELPSGAELALYPASVKAEDAGIMAIRRAVPQANIKVKKKDVYESLLQKGLTRPSHFGESIFTNAHFEPRIPRCNLVHREMPLPRGATTDALIRFHSSFFAKL